ncbi:hypothetical protein ACA910_014788 [Epithemia clementina (nom. ined.)]
MSPQQTNECQSAALLNELRAVMERMASLSDADSSFRQLGNHCTTPDLVLQTLVSAIHRMQSPAAAVSAAADLSDSTNAVGILSRSVEQVMASSLTALLPNGPAANNNNSQQQQARNMFSHSLLHLLRNRNDASIQNQFQILCSALTALQQLLQGGEPAVLNTQNNTALQHQTGEGETAHVDEQQQGPSSSLHLSSLLVRMLLIGLDPAAQDQNRRLQQQQQEQRQRQQQQEREKAAFLANVLQSMLPSIAAAAAAPSTGASPEVLLSLIASMGMTYTDAVGATTTATAQSSLSTQIAQHLSHLTLLMGAPTAIQQTATNTAPHDTGAQSSQGAVSSKEVQPVDSSPFNNGSQQPPVLSSTIPAPPVAAEVTARDNNDDLSPTLGVNQSTADLTSQVPPGADISMEVGPNRLLFLETFFPHKLHRLVTKLESEGMGSVVSFLDDGGLWVRDRRTFVKDVMPSYFRGSSWSSFRRQLYSYQFPAVTEPKPVKGAFANQFFLRGRPGLCYKITRDERQHKKPRPAVSTK